MGGELEPKLELEPNQGNETLRERNFSIWQRKLPRELTHTHTHYTHTHTYTCTYGLVCPEKPPGCATPFYFAVHRS